MKTSISLVLAALLVACGTSDIPLPILEAPRDGSSPDVALAPESGTAKESGVDASGGGNDDDSPGASVDDAASETGNGVAQDASAGDAERMGADGGSGTGVDVSREPANGGAAEAGSGSPAGPIFDPCATRPQPGYDPAASGLTACCVGVGPAHCVSREQVIDRLTAQLESCEDSASVCMPDEIIVGGGNYRPADCTSSLFGSAGACVSRCIALIRSNPQAVFLQRDGCPEGDLCVPCVNPLDGTATGACQLQALLCPADASMGGVVDAGAGAEEASDVAADVVLAEDAAIDAGEDAAVVIAEGGPIVPDANSESPPAATCPYVGPPLIDPGLFPSCSPACGGAHCVPQTLIPAGGRALLAGCVSLGGTAGSCAPDAFIESLGNFVPRSCTSIAGAEGRCISQCVPAVADRGELLPTDVCAADERCVPCFDPTAADPTLPTGVCSIASCDHPVQPPVTLTCPWTGPAVVDPTTLAECNPACAGAHCLPAELLPADLRDQLMACAGGFCAPDSVIASAGNAVPPECLAFAGTSAPGRCLSSCLPQVQGQPTLEQSTCAPDSRCVPCNDPLSGVETGACSTSCDSAPPSPYTFPGCCNSAGTSQGRCVPRSQIPDGQESSLLQDVCTETSSLCVPRELLPGGSSVSCTASVPPLITYQGRCLSNCLNLGPGGAIIPRGDCPADHVCFPCANVPTAPGCS